MSPRLSIKLLLLSAPLAAAQTHRVATPQRVTRAIGVYEYTGELAKPSAARLIPVSLYIDSHFEDAGVYLARPVPFVLQTGNVYSIEQAGQPLGTFDVDFVRDIITRHSATDDNPFNAWFGYGRFTPPAPPAKTASLKPSATTATITGGSDSGDDDRPHFVLRDPPSTGAATPSSRGTTTSTPAPDDADDPDRPTLRHRDPKEEAARKKEKKEKPTSYVSGPSTSLNDDPSRPSLRRGTPPEDVLTPQLSGLPPNLHQAVAVSDAANRDPHPFARAWDSPAEHAAILSTLEDLARPRIANYLAQNKLTAAPEAASPAATAPAKPPTRSTAAPHTAAARAAARRKAAATPPPPPFSLDAEHLSGYTLSYGGLPTFLYTVEIPLATGGPVYLTLVAQRLPAGEVQVALSSITDATHMDRTPWLRPIDVVDPDNSHRASLLFELRAQSSRQFALYRLISAQAEQTFITNIIE